MAMRSKDQMAGRAAALGKAGLGILLSLLGWVLLAKLLPSGAPAGIVLSGVVFGSLNGLIAIGIVLVYRANKVVNFAQAEFGSVAAVVGPRCTLALGVEKLPGGRTRPAPRR